MSEKTPVIVVGYNRAQVLASTVQRLLKSEGAGERRIFIYLDGARSERDRPKIEATFSAVSALTKDWDNVTFVRREKNFGCRENIFRAVSEVLQRFGTMILIEDDVLVSKTFLCYMDDALDFYKEDKRIWNINGYSPRYVSVPKSYPYDVYLNLHNWTPGWGIWKDRWDQVDFDLHAWDEYKEEVSHVDKVNRADVMLYSMLEKQAHTPDALNAWDVQCAFHMIKNDLYSVSPRLTLTKNVGFGMDSEHCQGGNPTMPTQRYYNFRPKMVSGLELDERIAKQFKYANVNPHLLPRIWRKLKRICWGLGPMNNEPIDGM